MKALITGANGQLGTAFQRYFEERGLEYVALGHEALNVADFVNVLEAVRHYKPDLIINCAAYNKVDEAERDWKTAYLINGVGVRNLSIASEEVGAVLVHFSTDYVFDGEKGEPYTIADTPNPVNKYGQSKLLGESEVMSLCERHFLIRTSWVFGVGGKDEANFIKKLMKWITNKDSLKVVTDQVSSPTYATDLAKAVLVVVEKGPYGLYHISNSGYCSRYEWAKYALELMGWKGQLLPAKSEEFQTPAKRPKFSTLDNFPLEEITGYELPDWRDATSRFLKEVGWV